MVLVFLVATPPTRAIHNLQPRRSLPREAQPMSRTHYSPILLLQRRRLLQGQSTTYELPHPLSSPGFIPLKVCLKHCSPSKVMLPFCSTTWQRALPGWRRGQNLRYRLKTLPQLWPQHFTQEPLSRITFSAHPTCHDVNLFTASSERLDVIIGFHTGDLIWLGMLYVAYGQISHYLSYHPSDPINSRYGRLNKQVRCRCSQCLRLN